jgi:hypothetical protein
MKLGLCERARRRSIRTGGLPPCSIIETCLALRFLASEIVESTREGNILAITTTGHRNRQRPRSDQRQSPLHLSVIRKILRALESTYRCSSQSYCTHGARRGRFVMEIRNARGTIDSREMGSESLEKKGATKEAPPFLRIIRCHTTRG